MPPRPVRPQYRQRSRRRDDRRGRGSRNSPLIWIIGGSIVVALVILASVVGWFISRRLSPTPTPTLPGILLPTATATVKILPTITLTPTETLQPTVTPRECQVYRNIQMYALPDTNAVSEPLAAGEMVVVVGEIVADGQSWYRVVISGIERYVPVNAVRCPSPLQ